MFNEKISNLTSSVFSGTKTAGKVAGEVLLQAALQHVGKRSPMFGDIALRASSAIAAESKLNSVRAKDAKRFALTEEAEPMAAKVKSELGDKASKKKIDDKVVSILIKLDKLIDKEGIAAAKQTDIYKKYESYYETYRKQVESNKDAVKSDKVASKQNPQTAGISDKEESSKLDYIEINTKNSAEILEKIESADSKSGLSGKGLSIAGAIDNGGGQIINKLFDNVFTKYFKEPDTVSGSAKESDISKTNNIAEITNTLKESSDLSKITSETVKELSDTVKELESKKTTTEISESNNVTTTELSNKISELTETLNKTAAITEKNNATVVTKNSVTNENLNPITSTTQPVTFKGAIDQGAGKVVNKVFDNVFGKFLGNDDQQTSEDKLENQDKAGKPIDTSEIVDELKKVNRFLDGKKTETKPEISKSILDKGIDKLKDKFGNTKLGKGVGNIYDKMTGARTSTTSDKLDEAVADVPDKKQTNNKRTKRSRGKLKTVRAPSAPQAITKSAQAAKYVPQAANTARVASAAGGLTNAASAAAKFAMPAAAVAAAGFAGYKAGEFLNENTNIQANIASGIDTAKGWFGNSDADKMKEADDKSVKDLYDKKIATNTLTAKSAKFFEDKGIKVDKSKIVPDPIAAKPNTNTPAITAKAAVANIPTIASAKSTTASSIEQQVNRKETMSVQQEAKATQPIVINANGGGSAAPAAAPLNNTTLAVGSPVRNQDSTFERVQMQAFWARSV